jgi:hypothetical protein
VELTEDVGQRFLGESIEETSLLDEMQNAFAQLQHEPLRVVLLESLQSERSALKDVVDCFSGFLGRCHSPEVRRTFFACWQKTNNSAMSVQGLANRITAEAEVTAMDPDAAKALSLFRAAGRLGRITDEDLGVRGQTLHFDLFYKMATELSGHNDDWQSRKYCLPSAFAFKSWLDSARLRAPILVGLYSILVHEGYTHAELETISRPFQRWAEKHMGLTRRDARTALAWINVHTGGTEKAHFMHSCESLKHYIDGSGTNVDLQIARATFRNYFRSKSAVMSELAAVWNAPALA